MKRALRASGLLFFTLFSICSSTAIWGQPVFYIQDQTIEVDTPAEIAVQVTDFTNILGLQFTLRWDSTMLEFNGLEDLTLGMTENDFGLTHVNSGYLTVAYFDMALMGFSLDDETVLFSAVFTPIGEDGEVADLVFSNDPTVQEITDANSNTLDATFDDGELAIMGPTSNVNQNEGAFRLSEVYPNPFQEQTQLSWYQRQAGQLHWEIRNELGQLISTNTGFYPAGQHQLVLGRKEFKQAGTYFVQLQLENYTITEKLVYIEP